MDTGATRTANVLFTAGSPTADVDLDLDLKGHWDIPMAGFSVADNMFRQELGILATLGFKVPLLGVDLSPGTDGWFDFVDSEFALAFNNRGYAGDDATPDVLGRFSIYVDPAPEPASAVLLGLGGLALLRRKRR
jgi:hypothetical protein